MSKKDEFPKPKKPPQSASSAEIRRVVREVINERTGAAVRTGTLSGKRKAQKG